MFKPVIAVAVIAAGFVAPQRAVYDDPLPGLKEEKMTLEYTATAGEAVVIVEAESEAGLERIEIRSPVGEPLFALRADAGGLPLSGFVLESHELEPEELVSRYTEGVYDLLARTDDGRRVRGSAQLSHVLLPAPVVLHPQPGAKASSKELEVRWVADPDATGYRVGLEQNENDGLTVELPPGTESFKVPAGVLEPKTDTQLEVGVIGPNGNCTLVEVEFVTD